jgi:hypothetical protein
VQAAAVSICWLGVWKAQITTESKLGLPRDLYSNFFVDVLIKLPNQLTRPQSIDQGKASRLDSA